MRAAPRPGSSGRDGCRTASTARGEPVGGHRGHSREPSRPQQFPDPRLRPAELPAGDHLDGGAEGEPGPPGRVFDQIGMNEVYFLRPRMTHDIACDNC